MSGKKVYLKVSYKISEDQYGELYVPVFSAKHILNLKGK